MKGRKLDLNRHVLEGDAIVRREKQLSNNEKSDIIADSLVKGLKESILEDLGETPENKKKADDMTEALLNETLKEINRK